MIVRFLHSTTLIAVGAASFAVGMLVGEIADELDFYGQLLGIAIGLAAVFAVVAVILYYLSGVRRRRGDL